MLNAAMGIHRSCSAFGDLQRRGVLLRLGSVVVGLLVVVGRGGLAGLLKLLADFGAGILELADAFAQAPG